MKYTLTCLSILTVILVNAQPNPSPYDWHFGLKADLNLSHIQGNGTASGYTSGFQAGGFAERVLDKTWSLQGELLFTQNNSKRSSIADFETYYNTSANPFSAEDIKLAYISIPVLIKYNVTNAFSFLAGPQYSILLVDAESLLRPPHENTAFKTSEFSGNVGAQFNISKVALYGRYNFGLANINNIENSKYAWHSSHVQLGIAVKIQ
jgi:Outer membrane protein beta-barrel domain